MKTNIVKRRLFRLRRRKARMERRASSRHYRIQIYFILIAFAVILGTLAVAGVLAYFAGQSLEIEAVTFPLVAWTALFVLLVSVADTVFLSHTIFRPISTLSHAMNRVAKGDFKQSLRTGSKIVEIRDSYDSFNRMVDELGTTETLQTDFVSSVSHEFKTPLAAIEGYAELLQDTALTEEERVQYTDKILYNTKRLTTLVGNMLLLSKTEHHAIPKAVAAYRMDEQIREVIIALESRWSDKELELDVELEEIVFVGNESMLYHVFSNLIDNAVKFSPARGTLTVRLFEMDGDVVFTVEDEGPGIPFGERERIFHKFYQTDPSHAKAGNGLGLALVKQLTELSGGFVTVSDAHPRGARFTVTLPRDL